MKRWLKQKWDWFNNLILFRRMTKQLRQQYEKVEQQLNTAVADLEKEKAEHDRSNMRIIDYKEKVGKLNVKLTNISQRIENIKKALRSPSA